MYKRSGGTSVTQWGSKLRARGRAFDEYFVICYVNIKTVLREVMQGGPKTADFGIPCILDKQTVISLIN